MYKSMNEKQIWLYRTNATTTTKLQIPDLGQTQNMVELNMFAGAPTPLPVLFLY